MTMPNFLIIGAAKSGTSALYHYLRQHPQIYMSRRKETHFFGYEGRDPHTNGPGDTIGGAVTNLTDYQALFADVKDEIAIGEASPTYVYVPQACERIKQYIPQAKLILILRHPADRAYSAFMHLIRDGREPITDFAKALKKEHERIQNNWGPIWHYTQGGMYYQQVKRYLDAFERTQIKIYLYDEFNAEPVTVLTDIFQFLDVTDDWLPDMSVRHNVSGVPKSRRFQEFLHTLLLKPNPVKTISRLVIPEQVRWRATTAVRNLNLIRSSLSPEMRHRLTEEQFREDILKLQDLLARDLSHWLASSVD